MSLRPTPSQQAAHAHAAAVAAAIVSGEPVTERKSTFQAHLAPIHSREDVAAVMAALLQNNKIAKVPQMLRTVLHSHPAAA